MQGLLKKLEQNFEIADNERVINISLDTAELSYLISLVHSEEEYQKKMEEYLYKTFDKTK